MFNICLSYGCSFFETRTVNRHIRFEQLTLETASTKNLEQSDRYNTNELIFQQYHEQARSPDLSPLDFYGFT